MYPGKKIFNWVCSPCQVPSDHETKFRLINKLNGIEAHGDTLELNFGLLWEFIRGAISTT